MPTFTFYTDTYGGDQFVLQTEFLKYAKRAYLLLNMYCGMCLDSVSAQFSQAINYAVCLQADFMYINGFEMSVEGISEGGFTVGKVRIDGSSSSDMKSGWYSFLSPLALNMLASVGLGARHIHTAIEPFAPYPWRW